MKILIAGASGFIGSALNQSLAHAGHTIYTLGRQPSGTARHFCWQPREGKIELDTTLHFDAVINLAGENIASRWTAARKDEILQSRVAATQVLCQYLCELERAPEVLINGSAMGYYGDTGDVVVNEQSALGQGFLAEVAQHWEAAARPAQERGIRTVFLRTGLVIHPSGGALAKMLLPFSLGLGGKMGNGQHFMSWISLADALRAIDFVIQHLSLSGPVNLVAPHPVRNIEFTRALATAVRRPAMLPMPAKLARCIFGEMADEALLASIRVDPQVLLQAGFKFNDDDLLAYLQRCLRKQE
ncbi:Epimerase family protein [Thalassocella blandensis]|nr:Epimerase family protein [Thalassocella blandensis]